jgi:hypothetical protein
MNSKVWTILHTSTSYVKLPDESGCLSVTLEIVPLAESMHTERGPFCENDIMRAATS